MNKSVRKNFFYQVTFNIVTMVIPIIVTPYLTRTLFENELGKFTYSRSIASYFVIFAMMGIVKYGQRLISQNINDERELRKSFWSLFFVHIGFSLVAILIYLISVLLFVKQNKALFWIQGIYVVSSMFDITWLYYGLEKFKGVVVRNAIIKVIESVLYIVFIKSPSDLLLYAFINCSVFLISQIVLIPGAIKEIKPISVNWTECKIHIKPLVVFSVAVIGISLYTVFDTTLLGLFSTDDNVAFYEYSNRIAKIPLVIASIIGTVLFPRACKLAAQNDFSEQKKYINFSMLIVSTVGAASFWGLLVVGKPLAMLYLGDNFINCGTIISSLAPLVYIVGIGDVVRTQIMIPNGMDKEYIISIVINAIVNLCLSTVFILLLPRELQVFGAVIGTVTAETVGMVYQIILCKKWISINYLIKTGLFTFVIGAIMYVFLRIIIQDVKWSISSLLMVIGVGAIIFIPLLVLYIWLFEKEFWLTIIRH